MARSITTSSSKSKVAATPFDAESSANSNFNGVYRLNSGVGYASYATVEADPWEANPDRRTELVKPRARWVWTVLFCQSWQVMHHSTGEPA